MKDLVSGIHELVEALGMKGHKGGKPSVTNGTVLGSVPLYDYKRRQTQVRVDVKDESGEIHISVPSSHPLAKAKPGCKVTVVQEPVK